MKNTRCEEVMVQLIIRTYDDMGRPVREQLSQPQKIFRNAQTLDFWGEVDKAVKALSAAPAAPPAAKPRGRGRR